ncbi:MAG: DUF2442 domain-containing protein [Propionibacteriaceae bacterium]|jgi:hypothetical protein|nr:DUF2442 domain-containing protein [Propionibacteriaceae bacterium]
MDTYWPEVTQAVAGPDHTVYAYLTDGTVRRYDAKPLLNHGGVFSPLSDEGLFQSSLTVSDGTIAWDLGGHHDPATMLDIDPFTVYQSEVVDDPLSEPAATSPAQRK